MRINTDYSGIAVQADGTSITWLVPSSGMSGWVPEPPVVEEPPAEPPTEV